jgi:membrane fusion protein, multidrug efflux system
VQVGPRVGTDRVTTSGLKAGEKVIVEGIQKVKSGVPVVAKLWTPNAERSAPEVENETRRVMCGAARSGTSAEPGASLTALPASATASSYCPLIRKYTTRCGGNVWLTGARRPVRRSIAP